MYIEEIEWLDKEGKEGAVNEDARWTNNCRGRYW